MSDQAFALSPISASGVSPTQSDYDAISEAFMETARGRWFLTEYARRNRNADTTMVLDAVARIERALAAQKDPPQTGVADILAAVRAIVATARDNAEGAMATALIDEALGPPRKCARVIREISWGLRESGADGRICTLLDAQVEAIDAACERVAANGLREGVLTIFDRAICEIAALAGGGAPGPQAAPAAADAVAEGEAPAPDTPLAEAIAEPSVMAMTDVASVAIGETPSDETVIAADVPHRSEIAIAQPAEDGPAAEMTLEPAPDPVVVPVIGPAGANEPAADDSSLGASLLASGIVAKPAAPRSDPLAALRRMSSAEKIAFFS